MANTRPYYRLMMRWTDERVATPPMIRRKLDVLQQIAACTAVECEERSYCGCGSDRETGFAAGVADVLAWLNGAPPTAELVNLLELEDED